MRPVYEFCVCPAECSSCTAAEAVTPAASAPGQGEYYRNASGSFYKVLGTAVGSVDLGRLVIYRAVNERWPYVQLDDGLPWACPAPRWPEWFRRVRACPACSRLGHMPQDHAGWDPTQEGHG